MVKKSYMKTAAILFYVSPSIIKTRIKNANTIDLMEGGKEQAQNVPNSEIDCCDEDGKEGKADGSSRDVPMQPDSEGAEQTVESGEVESSSGKGFSSPGILHPNVDPQEPVHFPPDIPGDGCQHLLPRRLPTRPALTRTQQRDDYVLLRQIESERLRAKQHAHQRANDVLDPPVRNITDQLLNVDDHQDVLSTPMTMEVAVAVAAKPAREEGAEPGSSSDSSDSSSDSLDSS